MSLDIAREHGFTGMYQEELGIQVLLVNKFKKLAKSPSNKIAGYPQHCASHWWIGAR